MGSEGKIDGNQPVSIYLSYPHTNAFRSSNSCRSNDPTQFEEVDETCGLSRVILYLEGLGMTVFLKTLYQSEYETLKFKPFQIEVENEKIRQFEHRCLSCRSC